MFWKLQENVVSESNLDYLISFIRKTKRFTQFTKVREFEATFAAWQGGKYCVFVNSGSSANLLLIHCLKELRKWRAGDEIIVPAVTWPTTITPIIQCGLKPVFSDVNLADLSFNYEELKSKITARTRGIFVVHLLGFPANIKRLREIVDGRDIELFEDCCEAQGAILDGIKVGNWGTAGIFSFYWGHHMTTVEGGMLCTNEESLFKLFVLKRSHGLARELPIEYHSDLRRKYPGNDFNFLFLTDGFNVRNTEFNAVLGLAQVEQIDEYIRIRNRNYERFATMCKRFPSELMVLEAKGISSFSFPFLFRRRARKEAFERLIHDVGIETRSLMGGNLLRQPFLQQHADPVVYPNAEFLHTNCFYIGNNQFVNDERLNILDDLMTEFFSP